MITGQLPEAPREFNPQQKKPLEFLTKTSFAEMEHKEASVKADQLEQSTHETRFHWKNITLMRVASSSFIVAVSFIPLQPSISQVLFASRTKDKEEDLTGFVPPTEFYAGEFASKITMITPHSMRTATRGIDAQMINDVQNILNAFLRDGQTTAIALTYRYLNEKVTRIWAKNV